ncbi:MAG: hypothetical protein E7256_04730 [Lachnospiraceae bacterium]|nr:hypothetical protein [Lachnospiraceae bacterium]
MIPVFCWGLKMDVKILDYQTLKIKMSDSRGFFCVHVYLEIRYPKYSVSVLSYLEASGEFSHFVIEEDRRCSGWGQHWFGNREMDGHQCKSWYKIGEKGLWRGFGEKD